MGCYRFRSFKGFLGLMGGLNESRIVFCDYAFWFNGVEWRLWDEDVVS